MTNKYVLDLTPVPIPLLRGEAKGKPVDFLRIVSVAGMKNVVSMPAYPDIRIHGGEFDFKVPKAGSPVYCLSGIQLPSQAVARAREILRRLAYGYHDWAAREIVSRYHRDLKRSDQHVSAPNEGASKRGLPASVRIRRFLRANPWATVNEISRGTNVAQPNVSRTISQWVENGDISIRKRGRNVHCCLKETLPKTEIGSQPKF